MLFLHQNIKSILSQMGGRDSIVLEQKNNSNKLKTSPAGHWGYCNVMRHYLLSSAEAVVQKK